MILVYFCAWAAGSIFIYLCVSWFRWLKEQRRNSWLETEQLAQSEGAKLVYLVTRSTDTDTCTLRMEKLQHWKQHLKHWFMCVAAGWLRLCSFSKSFFFRFVASLLPPFAMVQIGIKYTLKKRISCVFWLNFCNFSVCCTLALFCWKSESKWLLLKVSNCFKYVCDALGLIGI